MRFVAVSAYMFVVIPVVVDVDLIYMHTCLMSHSSALVIHLNSSAQCMHW